MVPLLELIVGDVTQSLLDTRPPSESSEAVESRDLDEFEVLIDIQIDVAEFLPLAERGVDRNHLDPHRLPDIVLRRRVHSLIPSGIASSRPRPFHPRAFLERHFRSGWGHEDEERPGGGVHPIPLHSRHQRYFVHDQSPFHIPIDFISTETNRE